MLPSYWPVKAIRLPSGEKRANISKPSWLVSLRATPPPAGDGVEVAGVGEDDLLAVDGGEAEQAGFVGSAAGSGPGSRQRQAGGNHPGANRVLS